MNDIFHITLCCLYVVIVFLLESTHGCYFLPTETSTRNVLYEKLDRLREVISVLLPIGVGRAPVGNTLLPSPGNKVSRKDLLLNTQQLIQEAYPMPVKAGGTSWL